MNSESSKYILKRRKQLGQNGGQQTWNLNMSKAEIDKQFIKVLKRETKINQRILMDDALLSCKMRKLGDLNIKSYKKMKKSRSMSKNIHIPSNVRLNTHESQQLMKKSKDRNIKAYVNQITQRIPKLEPREYRYPSPERIFGYPIKDISKSTYQAFINDDITGYSINSQTTPRNRIYSMYSSKFK